MEQLSAGDSDRLSRLLAKSVNLDDLEQCVWLATGDHLHVEYVAEQLPLKRKINDLIRALEIDRTTPRLAAVLYQRKQFNAELRQTLLELFPGIDKVSPDAGPAFAVQSGGVAVADPAPATVPGLQRVIRPKLSNIDIGEWLEKLKALTRQICRIELDREGVGTGFLVSDGRVLTNWHVVEQIRKLDGLNRMEARFDYHASPNGTRPGQVIKVAAILDELPCAPGELAGQADARPEPDQLDYALLALEGSTADRGHIQLRPAPPVGRGDPIIILQHPQAATMKLALDDNAVIGVEFDGLRLRYHTNTEGGSSGSPCFNWDLDLVALHHLGDPALTNPKYNQGIPIDLIIASLSQRVPGEIAGG
ncbi:trypsin-like serine peptidase [Paracoccus versutus]|uniref:trypsin-like serine peptidase n=1 Tax=Paracoccus versutus TaxID=34007 RepID=UPI000DF78D69|nr:serine protease [Paracoccus versutus]RDD68375.1 serine protease [Paracoccus versutus]